MRSLSTSTIAGTVTTGGTSQQITPRNPKRDLLMLQNPAGETGALFYNLGSAAAVNGTLSLAPGDWVKLDGPCAVPGDAVHVVASNSGPPRRSARRPARRR